MTLFLIWFIGIFVAAFIFGMLPDGLAPEHEDMPAICALWPVALALLLIILPLFLGAFVCSWIFSFAQDLRNERNRLS